MTNRRHRVTLVVALALAAPAPAAHAAEAATAAGEQQAAAKFRSGIERYDARDFAGALALFQEAWQLSHSPNARLYVARCFAEQGRNVEAHTELTGVIVDATASGDARYERTREAAQAELTVIGLRVAKLVITLPDLLPGLSVTVNDAAVTEEQLGIPLVLAPGKHHIAATATGMKPLERDVDVAAGQSKTVTLALSPAAEERPRPEPAPRRSGGLGAVRTAGLVTAGAGVAGLGLFAVTGLMAKSKYDSVHDACGGTRCADDKYASDIDSGKSLQTVANVSLVFGSLALVAGGSFFLFGPRPEADDAAAAYLLPGGGYASYRARF